ncbi:MAG: DUF4203 domain-containing protein [Christensenellaceae bacterium]
MGTFLPVIFIVLMLALGAIYCFWGYRYLKIIIIIYALFAGFYFMNNWLLENVPQVGEWAWLIAIAVGCILALLSFFFIKFAIFLAGGLVGLMVFNIVQDVAPAAFSGMDSVPLFLIGAAFFIILGLITLAAQKHLIIIFSGIYGAYTLVYCIGILVGLFSHTEAISHATVQTATTVFAPISFFADKPGWAMALPVILLAILGIVSQYKASRGNRAAYGKRSRNQI